MVCLTLARNLLGLADGVGADDSRRSVVDGGFHTDEVTYIEHSPYFRAGLYDRVEICEYSVEAGHLA